MPKEPESTVSAGFDLVWFFLPAVASAENPNHTMAKQATAGAIRETDFTRLLLVERGLRSFSGRGRGRFPKQFPLPCGHRLESSMKLRNRLGAGCRRVPEIGPCCRAAAAPFPLRQLVQSN